ncbi:MAG: methionine sulfoxide reductase catalytic subunit, partial [Pyrinomonadaceae bacterium]|nr:methionine sulfoxide reductase catalytic subunit [Pyrinomonadaceae bacterium]
MLIKKPDDIKSSEITDKKLYLTRRNFMRAAALAGTTAATGLVYRRFAVPAPPPVKGERIENVQTAEHATSFPPPPGEARTSYEEITNYNNFYEFSTGKTEVAGAARGFVTRPWTVAVEGMVQRPRV